MSIYQWALGNGKIISAEYNASTDRLSNEQVCSELKAAFQQFGHHITCSPVSDYMDEVYIISFEDSSQGNLIICAKGMTPGGRGLKNEQRTQQRSRFINYAYQQKEKGYIVLQLGVYKREGQTIFCAWKLNPTIADEDMSISKQIKITTIAQAMKEGFAQQKKSAGEYACAFRKEFIFFYIRNADWLHGNLINGQINLYY